MRNLRDDCLPSEYKILGAIKGVAISQDGTLNIDTSKALNPTKIRIQATFGAQIVVSDPLAIEVYDCADRIKMSPVNSTYSYQVDQTAKYLFKAISLQKQDPRNLASFSTFEILYGGASLIHGDMPKSKAAPKGYSSGSYKIQGQKSGEKVVGWQFKDNLNGNKWYRVSAWIKMWDSSNPRSNITVGIGGLNTAESFAQNAWKFVSEVGKVAKTGDQESRILFLNYENLTSKVSIRLAEPLLEIFDEEILARKIVSNDTCVIGEYSLQEQSNSSVIKVDSATGALTFNTSNTVDSLSAKIGVRVGQQIIESRKFNYEIFDC